MATLNLFVKTERTDINGYAPLILRMYHDKKTVNKTLKFKVMPKHWDSKKQRVTVNHPHFLKINRAIEEAYSEAGLIVQDAMLGKNFNRSVVRDRFNGNGGMGVVNFWKTKFKEYVMKNYQPETQRSFESEIAKFEKFAGDVMFSELTHEFILQYHIYMKDVLNNKDSTIRKSMKRLKRMLHLAEQLEDIESTCFKHYTMPKAISNPESLEVQEVDLLLKKLLSDTTLTGSHKRTLATFLLQCFTGMRYANALEFDPETHIKNDWVDFISIKTGEHVFVPVHRRLRNLLNITGGEFNPPANAVMNRNLKDLAVRYDINRVLKTHTAVHSFCTVSIELGVPVEVVQSWRGHKDISTTMIYTHIRNKHSKDMMQKWDDTAEELMLTKVS